MSVSFMELVQADDALTPSDIRRPTPVAGAQPIPRLSPKVALQLGRRQARSDVVSSLPLLAIDLGMAVLASMTASAVGRWLGTPLHPQFAYGVVVLTIVLQYIHGLYPGVGIHYPAEFRRVLHTSLFVSIGAGFAMAARMDSGPFQWASWMTLSAVLFLGLASARPIARHRLKRYRWWTQPVAVLGRGERAMRLHRRIQGLGHEGFRVAGLISDANMLAEGEGDHLITQGRLPISWLGPTRDLEAILRDQGICRIAVAERDSVGWRDFHCFHGIPHVMLPADLGQQPIERMRLRENSGEVEICCDTSLVKPLALAIKRVADVTLILVTAPFWLAVMGVIVVMMRLSDPGPIFYRQRRVGRYGDSFDAIKFRSMVVNADRTLKDYLATRPELKAEWKATHKLRQDPRITKVGRFLRGSSLDELPQLFNVLRGEMSLVGPRPIVDSSDYDREYIQDHPDVFELYQMVRPGITGLWQVNGRNRTTYKERVFNDRFYLHNWSLSLDLYILWRTIKTAIFREGAC